ncbi:MAG TPA: Gfo/Idh/MocA family oxidoreductase [Bryobacteraceae bacterium]|nr:Gfo/Idh/MocA family oxidoreductase [Bryobacteraceae bacterium]
MSNPIRVAVAGLGRMGGVHALHVQELAGEGRGCELVAVADLNGDLAREVTGRIGSQAAIFPSVAELAHARCCDAVVLVTPTENHFEHASMLIETGHRVLMEKPLTGTLESDRAFAEELDRKHPDALMLAFQRRFDEPLRYAKELMEAGAIGRVFKVYSALEDSGPAPQGYKSGGILPDMSVHNVDEILWLTGDSPRSSLSIGARLYSHALTTSDEDFDDALLYVWFESGAVGQVQVSRNHVSGYRVETILFGEEGHIHVGRFDQKLRTVVVEAYGRRGRSEPIAFRSFEARDYGANVPEFVDRFGAAYKAEVLAFIECCRSGQPFPTSHRDGLRAQEVISAGMQSVMGRQNAASV